MARVLSVNIWSAGAIPRSQHHIRRDLKGTAASAGVSDMWTMVPNQPGRRMHLPGRADSPRP